MNSRTVSSARTSILGALVLAIALATALAAPVLAPHANEHRFPGLLNAPPTAIHIRDTSGHFRPPFIHPWRLLDQLEQRYEPDVTVDVPLDWFTHGHLVASGADERAPLLLLGSDSYGRDVFAQLLYGARVSLGLSLSAAALALWLGALAGGVAGYVGGRSDDVVMRGAEFVLVLPAMYVALALRAVLPLVLTPLDVFLLLLVIFAILGAPIVARGVRGIVRTERRREYVIAAESLGAGRARVLWRHLIPAARGFLLAQLVLLVPSFVVAEATLSYVGFGFPEPVASWGTMLHDASSVRAIADFPWLLSPAVAMFVLVFGLNLVGGAHTDLIDGSRARTRS